MFYTMKQIVLLVAASLMLVAATIAIAKPNPVQANPNFDWCVNGDIPCFSNKGDCKKELGSVAGTITCQKVFKIR